jgi:RNA polymerase sigma factor (sigma-70 family)
MDLSSAELLNAVRRRDSAAEEALFARYVPQLQMLVRSRLSTKIARRVDGEDVVQSAMQSFFVRAADGEFSVDQSGDLWRLLATITLRKLAKANETHRAAKRDAGREFVSRSTEAEMDWLRSREPTPADATAAAEELFWLMRQIPGANRQALQLRMQGFELAEIAERLQCSERSVRRWLDEARELMQGRLDRFSRDAPGADAPSNPVMDDPCLRDLDLLDPRNYLLHRLIGSGGVCKVYEATDRRSGQRLCIKVLRRALRHNRRYVHRFFEEFRLTNLLSHPRIVKAHGIGRLPDGGYFLAIELIVGKNLQNIIGTRRLNPIEAGRIVAQVADALAHAHDQGIVHCDLKPANVLVDAAGDAWLTDFGFARELKALNDAGIDREYIAGTLAYSAPEQTDLQDGLTDPATDVHGLGAILFAVLSGVPPYGARSLDQLRNGEVNCDIDFGLLDGAPQQIVDVCRQALSLCPKDRCASAAEFASRLRVAISDVPAG